MQVAVVAFTGSTALLADTIHNFGDGLTAIPLWLAFRLSRIKPNQSFTYGYGRAEDLAGLAIVIMIAVSALVSAYVSIQRLFTPLEVRNLWAVAAAAVIGVAGNEAVAIFRIRIGKEIGSAALVADGYHSRVDGLTSMVVLVGVIGVWLGYPLADPIVGLLITIAIVKILWDSAKPVLQRIMDGVDPEVVNEIHDVLSDLPQVEDISEVRVRWMGHRMHAELNIAVDPLISVREGHTIAVRVQKHLLETLDFLSSATIHVDPVDASGSQHHQLPDHSHGHPH